MSISTPVGAPAEAVGGDARAPQENAKDDVVDESLKAIFDEAEVPLAKYPHLP